MTSLEEQIRSCRAIQKQATACREVLVNRIKREAKMGNTPELLTNVLYGTNALFEGKLAKLKGFVQGRSGRNGAAAAAPAGRTPSTFNWGALVSSMVSEDQRLLPPLAAPPPRPARLAPLAPAPVAELPSARIEELNDMIGSQFGVKYDASQHEDGLEMGAQQDLFPCGRITLQCLHADAKNLDCFIHSFLIATCANFRAAKISDPASGYLEFATHYRRDICKEIVDTVYANPHFVPLGGKATAYTAETLKQELLQPGAPLPDDLVKCLCFYYNINIVIIGPGGGQGRMARLVQGRETREEALRDTYKEAYVISNKYGGHFEPCRIQGENRYKLTAEETRCIVQTYNSSKSNPMMNPMNIARPVNPAAQPAVLAPGQWECLKCTFHNPSSATACELCGTERPKAALPATALPKAALPAAALPKAALPADGSMPIRSPKMSQEEYIQALTDWFKLHPEETRQTLAAKKGGRRTQRARRKKKHGTRIRRISSYGRRR